MKWFGRAPALWMTALLAVAQFVETLLHLSQDQQNATTVVITGLFSLVTAVCTRPIDLSIVTGIVTTLATALVAFKINIPADFVSGFNLVLVALANLVLTNLVSPSAKLGGPLHLRARSAEGRHSGHSPVGNPAGKQRSERFH